MSETGTARADAPGAAAVRNVVLVGPAGSGKTTLARALAAAAGEPERASRTDAGLAVLSVDWAGTRVSVIDAPGSPERLGELRAGLRAADGALFVVGSTDGIDDATRLLWAECEATGMPRAVVVTKLDRDAADFDETVAVAQRLFDGVVVPAHLPVHDDDGSVAGFIDLVSTRILDWSPGALRVLDAEAEHLALIGQARAALAEGIATGSEDEALLEQVMAGEHAAPGQLTAALRGAVATGRVHPVLGFAARPHPVGAELVLDLVAHAFPSPLDRPAPAAVLGDGSPADPVVPDPDAPVCAEVVHAVTSAGSSGEPATRAIVRIYAGTLRAGSTISVRAHGTPHADVGIASIEDAGTGTPATDAGPGSVVVVALAYAPTASTICAPGSDLSLEPWALPVPVLPVGIHRAGSDRSHDAALARAVDALLRDDPTLRRVAGTDAVWTLGTAHAAVIQARLRDQFGIEADAHPLTVDLLPADDTAGPGAPAMAPGIEGTLLEPVSRVRVEVPDAYVEDVMRDLSRRRATGATATPSAGGMATIEATVPDRELVRYAVDLRAISQVSATLVREPAGHAPMPPGIAATELAARGSR